MKISWKIDFIRSIKLLLYISIHFLNARSLFLPSPQLIPSNLTASCLCTILVYFLLFNIYRWLLPTKNLVVFYLNINAYIPHMHSRKKKSIRRSENKDQKEMINSKKERKNSKTERKNTPARTYENTFLSCKNARWHVEYEVCTLHGIVTMIQLEDSHKPLYDSFWINNETVHSDFELNFYTICIHLRYMGLFNFFCSTV